MFSGSLLEREGYLSPLSNHDIEETWPLHRGPAWCSLEVDLTLYLASLGGLPVLGKGLKG
jgi:hypothetical protein